MISEHAGLAYPIRDGIPIMLVDEARTLDADTAHPTAGPPEPGCGSLIMAEPSESFATDPFGTQHWPVEVRLKKAEKRLEIEFDNGRKFSLPAEFLRVESPSAEVQGHNPSQKQIVSGRRHVGDHGA